MHPWAVGMSADAFKGTRTKRGASYGVKGRLYPCRIGRVCARQSVTRPFRFASKPGSGRVFKKCALVENQSCRLAVCVRRSVSTKGNHRLHGSSKTLTRSGGGARADDDLWGGEHVDGLAGGFRDDGEGLVGPLAGGFAGDYMDAC